MFGTKLRKKNQNLLAEIKRLTEECKKEEEKKACLHQEIRELRDENQKLKSETAKLKGQYDKNDVAVVIDTNIPLYWAGAYGEQKLLDNLEGALFIPWAVHKELQVMYYGAKREDGIREEGDRKKIRGLEEFLSQLSAEERETREKKGAEALIAYPFVQEKIEQGKWKLIGRDVDIEPYFKGFNGKVEKELKLADAKILACCLYLADKFEVKKVVLLTRDRGLGEEAKKYGIRVEIRLSNLIKK